MVEGARRAGRWVSSRGASLFLLSKTVFGTNCSPERHNTESSLLEYITEQEPEDQLFMVALLCSAGPSVVEWISPNRVYHVQKSFRTSWFFFLQILITVMWKSILLYILKYLYVMVVFDDWFDENWSNFLVYFMTIISVTYF